MRAGLPRLRSTLIACLGIVALALICYRIVPGNATVAAIALLLGVLLSAAYAKLPEAIVVSVTATLCLDYFFVPPIRQVAIANPQDWIVLMLFLTGSLVATSVSRRFRQQRDELISRQKETEKLHALSRSMLLTDGAEDVRRLVINKCIELFGLSEAVLFESATGEFHRSQSQTCIPDEKIRRAALYGSVDRDEISNLTIVPVTLGNKNFGSLGFRGASLPEPALQSLGNIVALALAQAQAHEAGSLAEAVRKSEELKSVMIDALAHDLKTPLTAIEAAADMLLQPSAVPSGQRFELLDVIQQETRGLRRMIGEAIHLARIDAKKLNLECEPVTVSGLLDAAVQSLGDRRASPRINIECAPDLPLVFVDRELIIQALKQLLDNALKYSPAASLITVSALEANGLVSISVRDQGRGLTEVEQGRLFEKFYRGRYDHSAIQGTGMGLAIAKEISQAHAGSLAVESQPGRGSRFTITLHAAAGSASIEQQPV